MRGDPDRTGRKKDPFKGWPVRPPRPGDPARRELTERQILGRGTGWTPYLIGLLLGPEKVVRTRFRPYDYSEAGVVRVYRLVDVEGAEAGPAFRECVAAARADRLRERGKGVAVTVKQILLRPADWTPGLVSRFLTPVPGRRRVYSEAAVAAAERLPEFVAARAAEWGAGLAERARLAAVEAEAVAAALAVPVTVPALTPEQLVAAVEDFLAASGKSRPFEFGGAAWTPSVESLSDPAGRFAAARALTELAAGRSYAPVKAVYRLPDRHAAWYVTGGRAAAAVAAAYPEFRDECVRQLSEYYARKIALALPGTDPARIYPEVGNGYVQEEQ